MCQEPYLTSGPSLVLALQRDNGVIVFDALLGSSFDKDSLLNKYGTQILRPKTVASVRFIRDCIVIRCFFPLNILNKLLLQANKQLGFFFDELSSDAGVQIETA